MIKFQQSKSWWQPKDIDWFIKNADFAFTNNGYKGNRVRIVTKQPLHTLYGKVNCFEFDNDRYGIMITSETMFSKGLEETIVEKSTDVTGMLIKFLNEWGAGEFVNPKWSIKSVTNVFIKRFKLIEVNEKNN